MATLTGQTIAQSYEQLLSLPDGGGNTTTLVAITDGDAQTTFCLQLATTKALINGSGSKLFFSDEGGEYISGDGSTLTITAGASSAMKLDDTSRISLSNNDGGTGNTVFGYQAGNLIASGDNYNVFIGHQVADADMTNAIQNVGVGHSALGALTEGDLNTAVGYSAGYTLNTASSNTLIGNSAGLLITSGSRNVLIGDEAGDNFDAENENVAVGHNAFGGAVNGADQCIAIGVDSLSGAVTEDGTVSIGANALAALTGGAENVAVGYEALNDLTTGGANVAIGYRAADALAVGESHNIAIGSNAMEAVDEGTAGGDADHNIALGTGALSGGDFAGNDRQLQGNIAIGGNAMDGTGANAQTGTIAIGKSSLTDLTTGEKNIAIGYYASGQHVSGDRNIVIGYQAMDGTGAGGSGADSDDNIFIGVDSGGGTWVNADSDNNVAIGNSTMSGDMNDANNNTAVGHEAGKAITDGDTNVLVGYQCGDVITQGYQNVGVGSNVAFANEATAVNQIVIGYGATGTANNEAIIGNTSIDKVYMAQDATAVVHCAGVNFPDTQAASGDVNTLDDYEEGVHAVTIGGATVGLVSSKDSLQYTKIGRLVTLSGEISFSSISSATGTFSISLPFTVADTDDLAERFQGTFSCQNVNFTGDWINIGSYAAQDVITCQISNDNSTWTYLQASTMASNTEIVVTVQYIT